MSTTRSTKKIKYMLIVVNVILLTLTVLGVIKSVFVGFDVDESYAITQSYRLVTGDNMFSEMWEPHQMSAFGSTFLMIPYLLIMGGDTTGIVLYLRIAGSVIHLLIGWWFYKRVSAGYGTTTGLLVMFAHVNFLPKWIVLPEFEVMQYWAVCILFLALLTWKEKRCASKIAEISQNETTKSTKRGFFYCDKSDVWLVFAGVALFMAMMTYPTMVLLYPAYVLFFFFQKDKSSKEKWRGVLIFTGTTFAIGVAFLLYLRSYMTVDEFIKNVSYIFMDESHSESLAIRVLNYRGELIRLGERMPGYLLWTVVLGVVISVMDLLINRKKTDKVPESIGDKIIDKKVLKYGLVLIISFLVVVIGSHIWGSLLENQNQFYLYFRFLFIALLGLICFFIIPERNKDYFLLGILPGVMGAVASVLVTNMSIEITMARMYVAVLATFMMVAELIREKYSRDRLVQIISYGAGVAFVIGLIVCKLVLVRVTGCLPVTLRMDMDWVKKGPAAGLLIEDDFAWQYNENIPLITENITETDRVLYFGCENIYYMVSGATIATPSVQGTTVFNEMFLCYYAEHPDKVPNVVIIDKAFIDNPRYQYHKENQFMLDWIEEEFKDAEVVETGYVTILRR